MTAFLAPLSLCVVYLLVLSWPSAALLDFETDFGGIPNDNSSNACERNTRLLNDVFRRNISQHETLQIVAWNRTIYFYPGIVARELENVHLIVDGTMRFERPLEEHLQNAGVNEERPAPCWLLAGSSNITISTTIGINETFTDDRRGLLDGQGSQYWRVPYIGYLELKNRRPPLFYMQNSSHVLMQRLILQDCPLECLMLDQSDRVLVRNSSIVSRRTLRHTHGFIDLSAFGTRGITVNASNHVNLDSIDIWTQDECVRVNDGSSSVKLDGINASGLGFAIASSGGRIHDILIHNSRLYRSVKGLYLQFYRGDLNGSIGGGTIEDIHIENVTLESTTLWPLWFGPAQQASPDDACRADPCSLCWPQTPSSTCNVIPTSSMRNITLRNVQINNPKLATGVILSDDKTAVLDTVLFDNVRVTRGEQLAYATKDLARTFSGLKQPVRDAYLDEGNSRSETVVMQGMTYAEGFERLDDYHGYELPSREFLGMNIIARISIIVGTCLCALSLVLLLAVCIRLQCRATNVVDDDSVLRPADEPLDEYDSLDLVMPADQGGDYDVGSSAGILTDLAASGLHDPLLPPNDSAVSPRRRAAPSRISRSCHVAPYHVIALLAAMYGLLVGLSWLIALPGRPDWEKLNRYYMCEGVTNGVATGSTWPVPYCFANETARFSFTQLYDHMSSFLRSHFVLAACLLTCFSLYIHFSFLFKERTARNTLASFGDGLAI